MPTGIPDPLDILIVDDHRVFSEVLAVRLRLEPGIGDVELAGSLSNARALLHTQAPTVVLLDFDLAGESGVDLLADTRAMPEPPTVLMLSGSEEVSEIIPALSAGASGWVPKSESLDTLLRAIKHAHRGGMYLSAEAVGPVLHALLEQSYGTQRDPSFVDRLTRRELEVLRCLVAGMTRAEVADALYVSLNTVRTHVQKIMHDAGVHSTLMLVAKARSLGVQPTTDVHSDAC